MREIIAVFQDCVLCGVRGQKKIAELANMGINIRKVGFTTDEGKELIHEAVFNHKIGSMPFYTDGIRFSTSIGDLLEEEKQPEPKVVKKATKKAKRTKKNKTINEETNNGSNTEV